MHRTSYLLQRRRQLRAEMARFGIHRVDELARVAVEPFSFRALMANGLPSWREGLEAANAATVRYHSGDRS